ncbi:MAG: FtsQ-type POTRA domain-containing protein [Anaerolineae bacterium]|nr:FtsQ-type POTRA domain-containing protein [Anaerolineae bacterium]MBT7069924.1 FtsQ-type POTRA domain-containing protein [Anaerolineae bacterium]MBT7323845.1 FtsQ-type POTRA domain-containing protein [Anaerolineae bacterium]
MSEKQNPTRAELVRQRRAAERAEKVSEMPVLKPVQPLRPSKKTSFVGGAKRKPKTRIYAAETLTLNPPNEALRSISMPAIRIEWRAASAFLTILLGVALYLMWTAPYFMVTSPQINGNQYLASEEISNALDLSGTPIFSLVPQTLERRLLLSHPSLKTVEITVGLPNIVSVYVSERVPVLIWQQDSGMAWIDAEGIAFRANAQVDGLITVSALGPPPAPVMDAATRNELAPPAYIDPAVVASLRALVAFVPAGTPIIYDPESALGWTDPRGWTVQLGDITEDFGLKLRLYETMTNWFVQNNIRPVLVNIEYPHTPYYRTEH